MPTTTVTPVDTHINQGGQTVGTLKPYEVVVPGRRGGVTATLLLSDDDAKRAGVFEQQPEQKAAPKRTRSKARTPRNKAAKPAADKASTPAPAAPVEEATDPDASE
jgi:hypothetical protein